MTAPACENTLRIFAHQIKQLCLANLYDRFRLSLYGRAEVDVFLSGHGIFYFTHEGQMLSVFIGSLDNAIATYTALCAPHFESQIVAQEQGE